MTPTAKKPGFIAGIKYFIRGFTLIQATGIRRFVVIPLAINMTLFISALWLGVGFINEWVDGLKIQASANTSEGIQWLDNLIQWISWIIIPLFVAAFMFMMFYTFTLVANLVGAPFNSLLAEKIEGHLTGSSSTSGSIMDMIKDIGGSFLSEFRKLLYFLFRALPLLILSLLAFFFPPLSIITGFLWFAFSAWMLTIEYSDYPMANHAMRFPDQRQTLKGNKLFSLGFGCATTVATMIPIVNFFVMPVAVAGATAMWVDYWKENIPQIKVE